jgi:hypothetical protein
VERIATIACAAVLAALVGLAGYLAVANPMKAKRQDLDAQMAKIMPIDVPFPKPPWDFAKWQQSVAAKQNAWQEIVAPAAPPPPKPKTPPDPKTMLKDVTFGRQGIGTKKVMMKHGNEPRGAMVAVGDNVNGLTIKEITKTDVSLSLTWEGQEIPLTVPRK